MNAASDGIFFVENGLSQNQSMHDRKNSVFPVIVSFHLRAVWKKLTDAGVFFARNRWLMGAHHGVQATIQKHINKVSFDGIGVTRAAISLGSGSRSSRPGRSAPPVNHWTSPGFTPKSSSRKPLTQTAAVM